MARRTGKAHGKYKRPPRDKVSIARRSIGHKVTEIVTVLSKQAGVDRGDVVGMVHDAWTRDAVGRPPIAAEQRKVKLVQVRVTAAEYDRLVRAAKRQRVTVSLLLRRAVKRIARSKTITGAG